MLFLAVADSTCHLRAAARASVVSRFCRLHRAMHLPKTRRHWIMKRLGLFMLTAIPGMTAPTISGLVAAGHSANSIGVYWTTSGGAANGVSDSKVVATCRTKEAPRGNNRNRRRRESLRV